MRLDNSAKIQIRVGGVYGGKRKELAKIHRKVLST
jgi:UV DNA damage repair endonuclease